MGLEQGALTLGENLTVHYALSKELGQNWHDSYQHKYPRMSNFVRLFFFFFGSKTYHSRCCQSLGVGEILSEGYKNFRRSNEFKRSTVQHGE
jgi:hypothetical protein